MSLSQEAYTQIKRKIISLEYPPGAVIREAELRQTLALGRTPIREALQRLAQEKLVNIVPRRGMFVTEIGITDLQQLFELRLALERLAARLAAQRGTDAHWRQMNDVLSGMRETVSVKDNERLIALDERCHEIIYEAADNRFLYDTLMTLYALSLRLWYFSLARIGDMQTAVLEHQQILDALQAGQAEEAALLVAQHIQAFQSEIQSVMLGPLV